MSSRSRTILAEAGIALAGLVFATAGKAHAAVTISSAATQNMSCSNGVCAPTAKNATLNAGDLENLLASGNVTVTTTGSGVEASDIRITDAITWSNTSSLSLTAHRSITVSKPVTIAGAGGLTLTDGGAQMLSFSPKGNVTFANLSSALSINGTSYTLENTIKALSSAIKGNPGGNYAFATSYDASKDGTYSSTPIPTTFDGTLDGLGNAISSLTVSAEKNGSIAALFAQIGSAGTVENLNLTNVNISDSGYSNAIGGLAGENDGTLYGDSVSGTVVGHHQGSAGGLAGNSSGPIIRSHSSASVSGGGVAGAAGGLVAFQSGIIADSYASGPVSVGSGEVTGSCLAGGLVAYGVASGASITNSFATGSVTGGRYAAVGGLAGYMGSVSNSYATGSVKGGEHSLVGGFAGLDSDGNGNNQTITASYSTGLVRGETGSTVGGFAGEVQYSGTTSDDYWDTTTSGTNNGVGSGDATGITGLTSQQLQSGLPQGFDPKIWGQNANVNDGFPYLLSNPPPK